MKIKNMITACFLCCGFAAALTSCSNNEDSFFTVTEDDAPRILNTDLPVAGFKINRDVNLVFEILVTPKDFTTVTWYADGKEVFTGANIDRPFEAGDYKLKIVATTVKGKQTSRDINLTVSALTGDPQTTSTALAERLVKAGATVQLHGGNLTNVKKVAINGQQVAATYDATAGCVTYTVPAGLATGTYRVSFIDASNNSYGAGMLTVVSTSTFAKSVLSGPVNGGSVTVEGVLLDKVTAISVNGQNCAITSQSDGSLTFTAPALAEGTYSFKATSSAGDCYYYNDGQLEQTATYRATSETTILEGNFVIDWNASICNVRADKLNLIPVGAKIKIYYEVPEAEYHNMRIIRAPDWVDVPGGAQIDVTPDTPNPYVLEYTQAFKDMVCDPAMEGMSCVGFGYTVTKITYE